LSIGKTTEMFLIGKRKTLQKNLFKTEEKQSKRRWRLGGGFVSNSLNRTTSFALHLIVREKLGEPEVAAPWTFAEIFSGRGKVDLLLILFRLLTMQCKLAFTKGFILYTPQKCLCYGNSPKKCSNALFCTVPDNVAYCSAS